MLSEAEEAKHNAEMDAAKRRYAESATKDPGQKLNKYQIAAYRKAFDRFDEDGSGEVSSTTMTKSWNFYRSNSSSMPVSNFSD